LVKQEDDEIIAIHILGKLFDFTSERAWHRLITGNLFTNGQFLERSRYNRRCRALRWAMKWIRMSWRMSMPWLIACPLALYDAARMHRVKRFQGIQTSGIALQKSNGTMG
jgi:hypothetical protein